MRTFFVTGGAGFIGAAFVHLILREFSDVRVINFDALTYAGNLDNLSGLDSDRHTFVRGDIRDPMAVKESMPMDVDAVVNFAAESHVDRSIESAHDFVTTNVVGTQVLLDAARGTRARKFCHISTDEVMGSLSDGSEEVFTEDSPFAPNSPYAASKAAAEHLVRAAHHTFGLHTLITRCGNNYGPRQFPEKLIPLAITNALQDREVPVYGDGRNVRDWIYVHDHCRAVLQVIERAPAGETYNIGARNEQRNIEVVESILKALNKPSSLIKFVTDRPGHDRRYSIDPGKIEKLGWLPRAGWSEGLEKTIDWYIKNPQWLARVRTGEYLDYYERQYGERASQK
ncbi:MAG: dTDP-glucose 4,6-dehydratase [Acidobacteria bacterium]|nr:dTDP-glucose 4,6-dehydratase [Acidobacteriota bacterium]